MNTRAVRATASNPEPKSRSVRRQGEHQGFLKDALSHNGVPFWASIAVTLSFSEPILTLCRIPGAAASAVTTAVTTAVGCLLTTWQALADGPSDRPLVLETPRPRTDSAHC